MPINYTSRDFDSIRNDLITHVKRYYPNVYQDFNEASFGAIMIDTVAYVGDILSFYMDYNVNESFLETSIEENNILKIARQMGYRYKGIPASTGEVTLYAIVPSLTNGTGPDLDYAPILKAGAVFSAAQGASFTLIDDVDFSNENNETVVAEVDSVTDVPSSYAIKTRGKVVSGQTRTKVVQCGEYERFKKVLIPDDNITEIISVMDGSGNRYYEVDYLTQDVVYTPVINKASDSNSVPMIVKPKKVPRRFVFEQLANQYYLQFGHGSERNLNNEAISDPSKVVLQVNGKDYVVDKSFDPTNLIDTDKMGIAPANTALTIQYRKNAVNINSISSKGLINLSDANYVFENIGSLSQQKIADVINSVEFENESPILGSTSAPSTEEIKYRAYGSFSSQNRAVTEDDYRSIIYNMPPKFGSVKRARITQDKDSFKRNLNLYVISEDENGNLTESTISLKNNLKTWLSGYKMINDTIDILDAKVVNLEIYIDIVADDDRNKYVILQNAIDAIKFENLNSKYDIGEPFRISDVFKTLKNIDGVLDIVKIDVKRKQGSLYSTFSYDIKSNTSPDGRLILAGDDIIFEIKYPDSDIVGTVR